MLVFGVFQMVVPRSGIEDEATVQGGQRLALAEPGLPDELSSDGVEQGSCRRAFLALQAGGTQTEQPRSAASSNRFPDSCAIH